jgi:hypothetical protein
MFFPIDVLSTELDALKEKNMESEVVKVHLVNCRRQLIENQDRQIHPHGIVDIVLE